jgi:outer membrane protein OmpA-like peptidoglycan-associated protein
MVNALYDINLGSPVTPYVGLGLGYGWNDFRGVHGQVGTTSFRGTGVDGALAYQGILGAAYSLSSVVPGLSLTAEARYYGTGTPSISATAALLGGSAHGTVRPTNDNISGLIGFRYAFGAPAPVPPAPPPATPVPPISDARRTYLVFFDWDRADLSSRAREIIREAAANAQRASLTRIEVQGHADRSGDPGYNQRLSQRRAEAVAAQLVRDGVARAAISVQAFGESRPLVPTADSAREPQNRRVEIVLR